MKCPFVPLPLCDPCAPFTTRPPVFPLLYDGRPASTCRGFQTDADLDSLPASWQRNAEGRQSREEAEAERKAEIEAANKEDAVGWVWVRLRKRWVGSEPFSLKKEV